MPIHFEIEKDAFSLEGLEKGIEQHRHESVVKMLQLGGLTHEKIALIAGVSVAYVQRIENELNTSKKL